MTPVHIVDGVMEHLLLIITQEIYSKAVLWYIYNFTISLKIKANLHSHEIDEIGVWLSGRETALNVLTVGSISEGMLLVSFTLRIRLLLSIDTAGCRVFNNYQS